MIYITGDTHGDIASLKNPKLKKLGEKDYLIICGDFGFIFNPMDKQERKNLEWLKKQKYTICFVDGAHENFDLLNEYRPYRWKGGNAQKIADNVYHLMRGEIFTLENKTFFVMGGGASEDAHLRVEGESWWESELPSAQDLKNGVNNLKESDKKIDYILTYEPPTIAKDLLSERTNRNFTITPINTYLQEVLNNIEYKHWYFGSLHMDLKISKKMTAIFNEFIEIS